MDHREASASSVPSRVFHSGREKKKKMRAQIHFKRQEYRADRALWAGPQLKYWPPCNPDLKMLSQFCKSHKIRCSLPSGMWPFGNAFGRAYACRYGTPWCIQLPKITTIRMCETNGFVLERGTGEIKVLGTLGTAILFQIDYSNVPALLARVHQEMNSPEFTESSKLDFTLRKSRQGSRLV